MESIFRWSSSRPWTTLSVAGLLCLGLAVGIIFLRVDASFERLLSDRDPRVEYLRNVQENFRERPLLIVLAESARLFDADKLAHLKTLSEKLAAIDGVVETSNLFVTSLPSARGGRVVGEAPLADLEGKTESLQERREFLLTNDLIRDQLLNARGDATLLLFYLESERDGGKNHKRILSEFAGLLGTSGEDPVTDLELTLIGPPLVKARLQEHILWDLVHLAPVALLVIGGLIFFFFRSFVAVFMPLLTGVLSSAATLGFMGYVGYDISIFLSTIIVLILVLGCTEDLRILSEYMDNLDRGMDRTEAISKAGASTGTALLLASSTTVLGFVSILFTEITGMREFAASCAFGLSINFLVTILVLPALLSLLPRPHRNRLPEGSWLRRLGRILEGSLLRRKSVVAALSLLLLLGSGAGMLRLVTDTDYLRFFADRSETVLSYERFNRAFTGASVFTVTLETGERRGVIQPDAFEKLLRLHTFLNEDCGRALGFVDLVNEYRKARGSTPATVTSPPSTEELASFLDLAPRDVLKPFLDFDGSRVAIRLRSRTRTSAEMLQLEDRILAFAAESLGPSVEVRVTGEPIVTAHLCERVTNRLVLNLVVLALVVAALISLIVRSVKQGLLAIIPNLFPIVTTFGAMGWLGIPLSIATFPVANIAFCIAVDDTIHFLLRYNAERRSGLINDGAVVATLRAELRPILATSVTISCGYLVMALSPLRGNAEVGLLFALATVSAVFADLVLTPVLLREFGGGPENESARKLLKKS